MTNDSECIATNENTPTIGELERTIAQNLQKLWREKTGQFPHQAIALFFEKKLVIWLQGILTPLEKTLLSVEDSSYNVVLKRRSIDQILRAEAHSYLSKILIGCETKTVLVTSDLDENCTAVIATLDQLPAARNLETVPKTKSLARKQ